jgi:hypothetical protein
MMGDVGGPVAPNPPVSLGWPVGESRARGKYSNSRSSSSSSSSQTLSACFYYSRYAGGAGLRRASVPDPIYAYI